MKNLFSLFSKSLSLGLVYSGLLFNTSWAELTLEVKNSFAFSKSDITILHLDKNRYKGTAATSDWLSNKNGVTYLFKGIALWIDPSNYYFEAEGFYGSQFQGTAKAYPLSWDVHGNEKGFVVETGYIYKLNEKLSLIPQIGFSYTQYDSKLSHQRNQFVSPNYYVGTNGDKNNSLIYYPYIGFELSFPGQIGCYKYQLSTSYDLGFAAGYSKVTVPHYFVTDIPSTSRYGSRIKLRNMLSHDFDVILSHAFAKHWQYALQFDYNLTYNTSRLPVKLQHNKRIVQAGQYTATQYHVCDKNISQVWSITFNLVYNFGETSVFVR